MAAQSSRGRPIRALREAFIHGMWESDREIPSR
jgi:hypothetical protein